MSEKILKFDSIKVNKKEFHKFKQPIDLYLMNVDQIVVSDKFKHNDDSILLVTKKALNRLCKLLIVKPVCIILPQMNGYIKYFENGGKNMSFLINNDDVLDKYNEIWDKIKEKLNIKFHNTPVHDETYIKAKEREFDGVIKTNFLGGKVPKENMHYTCMACITIVSVIKTKKKNYVQVYLEECKYKIKKIQLSRFINTELNSESELESGSESCNELMAKLKSNSDTE